MAKCTGDEEEIKKAVAAMVIDGSPQRFDPADPGNVLRMMEEQFEHSCAAMEEMGVSNPKGLTEFEFYSRLTYYEKKHKKQSHAGSK